MTDSAQNAESNERIYSSFVRIAPRTDRRLWIEFESDDMPFFRFLWGGWFRGHWMGWN